MHCTTAAFLERGVEHDERQSTTRGKRETEHDETSRSSWTIGRIEFLIVDIAARSASTLLARDDKDLFRAFLLTRSTTFRSTFVTQRVL
jgi:hypothetical protein